MTEKKKIKYEMITAAKELYLEINKDGKRKYSITEIAEKINNKYKNNINRTTVFRWSKKYCWQELYTKMKQYGLEKALEIQEEEEEDVMIEEKIIEKESDVFAEIFRDYKILFDFSKKTIKERFKTPDEISNNDLIKLMKISSDVLMDFHKDSDPIGISKEAEEKMNRIFDMNVEEYLENKNFS